MGSHDILEIMKTEEASTEPAVPSVISHEFSKNEVLFARRKRTHAAPIDMKSTDRLQELERVKTELALVLGMLERIPDPPMPSVSGPNGELMDDATITPASVDPRFRERLLTYHDLFSSTLEAWISYEKVKQA